MRNAVLLFILFIRVTNTVAQPLAKANYDEAKVLPYQLPDLLTTATGTRVSNIVQWEKLRRPEIISLFENNVYGQLPVTFDSIRFSVKDVDTMAMDGQTTLKQGYINVFNQNSSVSIRVVLFVPNHVIEPCPVFLLINHRGVENTDPLRQKVSGFWPAEMAIEKGYAIAAFQTADLAPDNEESFAEMVFKLYPEQLKADNGMRTIGAWAWGASRVMDYFETDSDLNSKLVVVVGHSRGGKASLWAAAKDQRFAACVANCSGNTGAALARRKFGERVKTINTKFPYWFTPNYKQFNDNEEMLPVDQHMLIAALAPRPVYITSASEDLWADPKGSFLSLKNAAPVYHLYNIKNSLPSNPPVVDKAIFKSKLAYHNRKGKHDLTAFDWGNFIRFADYNLRHKPLK